MMAQVHPMRSIDEDTFIERFRPRPNPFDFTGGFDFGSGCCLFSAVGKDFRYVLAQKPTAIWTVIEGDEGALFIESGLHLVNRLGYLVTEVPREDGGTYLVALD